MQSEFIFRGSLLQFWHAVSSQARRAPKGIRAGYSRQLAAYGNVTVEFLDERHRLALIIVQGLPGPDGNSVKVRVHIQRAAYTDLGKFALLRWIKMKRAWEKEGLLIKLPPRPIENAPTHAAKPREKKSGRSHSGIQRMLEKIAHRDYCLRKNGQPSKWSEKWQGAIDSKTAISIDRDLNGKLKGHWNDPRVSGDWLVELLFKEYPDFEYLRAMWEELKNKEF